jgi:SAM-dependent methyltransferase
MGYVADYFEARVGSWIAAGWLPRSGRVADLGAQEFHGSQKEAKLNTSQFLRGLGISEARIEEVCLSSGPLSVSEVYRAMGIDYIAMDLTQASDVRFFDLNCFAPPLEWRMAFDLVNNEGTIEHLINPINGFQVAHELLKVGGVAVHSIPLTGHCDHGLMQPTMKFYERLVGVNGYDLLLSEISIGQSQPDFAVRRFALRDQRGSPLGRSVDMVDAWLHIAYRKNMPADFRAPFSHWNGDDTGELGERAAENARAFSRRRLTERGRHDPIGDDFERQLELQRREQEHQTKLEDRSHENRRKLQVYEHQHEDKLIIDNKKLEDQSHENRRKLQVYEHQHEDTLTIDVQRREHEHSDMLQAALQRREAELRKSMSGIAGYVPLLAIGLASVLNGAALLTGLSREWGPVSWLFAAGLVSGFLPTAAARRVWTGNPGRSARLTRNASRALCLLSIVLFAVGCLVVGTK